MIKYSLVCDSDHQFEAWFSGSAAFDRQTTEGLLACPFCGSAKVGKALMAPNVVSSRKHARASADQPAPIPKQTLELMRKLRRHVREHAEYVGGRFAEEARKIHLQEAKPRGIYGEATAAEAQSLREDGVEFYPLPRLPEDHD